MKLIIEIPDNELKNPLKNIHLLIDNGIITEVCIKKYDKDEPYFMNLNYAPLEECDDCISRLDAINIVVCDILSSAIVYGRTEEGMAARKAIIDGLKRLPPVTPAEKVGQWRHYEGMLICSECGAEYYDEIMEYCGDDVPKCCPDCGSRMRQEREE